jgi:hypothetical protein
MAPTCSPVITTEYPVKQMESVAAQSESFAQVTAPSETPELTRKSHHRHDKRTFTATNPPTSATIVSTTDVSSHSSVRGKKMKAWFTIKLQTTLPHSESNKQRRFSYADYFAEAKQSASANRPQAIPSSPRKRNVTPPEGSSPNKQKKV